MPGVCPSELLAELFVSDLAGFVANESNGFAVHSRGVIHRLNYDYPH